MRQIFPTPFPADTTVGTGPLIAQYLAVICDLDGVVYRGATPVPGAVETLNRLAADDTAVVFAGANAAGLDSLLVLSGASRLQDLAFAPRTARPTYGAADITGLLEPGSSLPTKPDDLVGLTPDGALHIRGGGDSSRLLSAVVATAWAALDAGCAVSGDAERWRQLEGQLGLRRTREEPRQ